MADEHEQTVDEPNVVLTGFMGTGKTTVGRVLAQRLGRPFVDTDALIEERHGPIPEIFAELGEDRFRELERAVATELSAQRGLVVSTGGRMLLDPVNAAALQSSGLVVCLVAPAEEILRRVSAVGVEDRPLLHVADPRARIIELLEERQSGYAAFPQVATVDVHPRRSQRRSASCSTTKPSGPSEPLSRPPRSPAWSGGCDRSIGRSPVGRRRPRRSPPHRGRRSRRRRDRRPWT